MEEWFVDFGCLKHMTRNKNIQSNYEMKGVQMWNLNKSQWTNQMAWEDALMECNYIQNIICYRIEVPPTQHQSSLRWKQLSSVHKVEVYGTRPITGDIKLQGYRIRDVYVIDLVHAYQIYASSPR